MIEYKKGPSATRILSSHPHPPHILHHSFHTNPFTKIIQFYYLSKPTFLAKLQFSIIALAAIFAAPLALANPLPSTPVESDPELFESAFKIDGPVPPPPGAVEACDISLEKRANGNVYMCQAFNWGGPCRNAVFNYNSCYNIAAGWNNTISSLGPDRGTACVLYASQGCKGSVQTEGCGCPGKAALPNGVNDSVGSIKCWW